MKICETEDGSAIAYDVTLKREEKNASIARLLAQLNALDVSEIEGLVISCKCVDGAKSFVGLEGSVDTIVEAAEKIMGVLVLTFHTLDNDQTAAGSTLQ